MGEVYRARDTKLGREAALKVLPPAFAEDAERLARFRREAQILASLSHPNIAAIYGLEESGGPRGAGDGAGAGRGPLRAARARPPPVDEALAVARQIAEALEEAHGKGDRPPRPQARQRQAHPDGKVKVLDFGLAKALSGDACRRPRLERLLPIPDDDAPGDPGGNDPRHRGLHEPRAGPRQAGGQAGRRLVVRRRPLGDALGKAALRRRDGERHARRGPARRPGLDAPPARPAGARSATSSAAASSATRGGGCTTWPTPASSSRTSSRDGGEPPAATASTPAPATPRPSIARRAAVPLPRFLLGVLVTAPVPLVDAARPRGRSPAESPAPPSFRQLTFLAGGEMAPALSPDGESFAYVKEVGGQRDVFLQRVGGNEPREPDRGVQGGRRRARLLPRRPADRLPLGVRRRRDLRDGRDGRVGAEGDRQGLQPGLVAGRHGARDRRREAPQPVRPGPPRARSGR